MTRLYLQNGGYWIDTDQAVPAQQNQAINILDQGALGDGVADDTAIFRTCMARLEERGGGGVLYLPRPRVGYVLQNPAYQFGTSFPVWAGCVDIAASGITVQGDSGGSRIMLRTPGGGNPDAGFALVSRYAYDIGTPAPFIPAPPAAWLPTHVYAGGAEVTAPNGHTYKTFAGGTSGSTPPSNISAAAHDIADGTVLWFLWDYTYRGAFFRIKSFAVNAEVGPGNIAFRDLIFDGQAPRQDTLAPLGVVAPPTSVPYDRPGLGFGGANFPAGAGWATGHLPVSMPTPWTYGPVTFERCEFRDWRSENVYTAGTSVSGLVTIKDCKFTGAMGDAVSLAAPMLMQDCTFDHCSQAIENDPLAFDHTYLNVTISNCGLGFSLPSNYPVHAGRGRTLVDGMRISNCVGMGILINGYAGNVTIRNTEIVDCSQVGGSYGVYITDDGGTPQYIDLDISFVCNAKDFLVGAVIFMQAEASPGNRFRARFTRTATAVATGKSFGQSLEFSLQSGVAWTVDVDARGSITHPHFSSSPPFFESTCRNDGLFEAIVGNTISPQGFASYQLTPGGAVNLTTPSKFPVDRECTIKLTNALGTVKNGAFIDLVGGADFTPGANGGEIVLKRASSASEKVFEVRRKSY